MPHYKLTYFDIRGRAEPIRMMFAVTGIPFEDNRIQGSQWPELKKETPFGGLPVLEVDGVQLAQSLAILRYVAREKGFGGPDNLSAAIADSLADQFSDFFNSIQQWLAVLMGRIPGNEGELYKTVYLPAKAKHFPYFEAALKKSSTGWYAGTADLTHADVCIGAGLEMLSKIDKTGDKFFEGFPLMEAQFKKFFAHPSIAKHVAERPEAAH